MISIHINNRPGKRGNRPGRGYTRRMAKSFDFQHAPGHLIRRAHQLAVAIFMEETGDFDITPVQFAILNALIDDPGEDQVTLAAQGRVRRRHFRIGHRPAGNQGLGAAGSRRAGSPPQTVVGDA